MNEPRWALRVALYAKALLRSEASVDTRLSIGIGQMDKAGNKPISLATGEAFTLSGHALDDMTRHFDFTGDLPESAGTLKIWFPAILRLCSGLVRPWTRRQAEIVSQALLLEKPTHEQIAESLRPVVKKQTVTESLTGASWRPLLEAIKAFESTDWPTAIGRH